MEKTRIIKIIIQHLYERGLKEVAQKLETESEISFERKEIKQAKFYLTENKIEEAINIIYEDIYRSPFNNKNTLQLENITQDFLILNKIAIFKIFDSLLQNDIQTAIKLTRSQISEISKISRASIIPCDLIESEKNILKKCSQLFFIDNRFDLLDKMKEISIESMSIENLTQFIDSFQLVDENFPNNKNLNNILDTVIKNQMNSCKYHNTKENTFSYFNDHICQINKIPNQLLYSIEYHNEEIINIIFSNSQKYFAAILKDYNIAIYKITRHSTITDKRNSFNTIGNNLYSTSQFDSLYIKSTEKNSIEIKLINLIQNPHKNQITSLQWNSNDNLILTASKDKTIKIFDVFSGICKTFFDRHDAMVSSAIFLDNDTKIISSGLDYKISFFNSSTKDLEHSINLPNVTVSELLYSNSENLLMVVSATTNSILLYDSHSKNEVEKIPINDVIISCAISRLDKGKYLLVNSSKSTPVLNLFNLQNFKIERKFFGHRQERFTNKCNFGGECERFLTCGSDDAKIYLWNRNHSIPVLSIKLHSSAVNSVIWSNSLFSDIILSCSDDHTIKIMGNETINKIFVTFSRENSKLKSLQYKMIHLEEKGNLNKIVGNSHNTMNNFNSLSSKQYLYKYT